MTSDVNALQLLDSEEQTAPSGICRYLSMFTCDDWTAGTAADA